MQRLLRKVLHEKGEKASIGMQAVKKLRNPWCFQERKKEGSK
jgi:hypothetical protein